MLKVPLKKPEPDFDEFLNICEGLKDPDRVHHVEVIVDEEIKKEIMEKHLDQKFHPPVGMFFGEADKSLKSLKKEDHIKAKEDYYRMNISFHYHMGYSFVTDHDFLINLEGFNTVSEKTNDTAALSRGERFWAQEGQGLIRTWDDYEDFPWNKAEGLVDDERYEHVKSHLKIQEKDAKLWRDACILYFQTFSKRPVPDVVEKPEHTLEYYKNLRVVYVQ